MDIIKCKKCNSEIAIDKNTIYPIDCDCGNAINKKQIPNEKMNFEEFMDSEGKTIIDDFLTDNKEFDRICKESYEEYLN